MNIEIGANEDDRHEGYIQVDMYGTPDVRADIRSLPFKNLDHIYASHVLEHLADADIVTALKSCRKALKPGATLEVFVPDLMWTLRKFLSAGSSGARWALWNSYIFGTQEHEGMFHKTGFSARRLGECLIAAGFRKVDTKHRIDRKGRGDMKEQYQQELRTIRIREIQGIAVV